MIVFFLIVIVLRLILPVPLLWDIYDFVEKGIGNKQMSKMFHNFAEALPCITFQT